MACPDLGQNPRLDVVQPLLRGFLDAILLDPAPNTAQKRSNVGASPELSKRSSRRQKRPSICRCTNARLLCQMVAPCMLPEGAQPHRFQSGVLDNVMTYERAAAPGVSSCERSASVQLASSTRHQNLISLFYVVLPSTDVQLSPYVRTTLFACAASTLASATHSSLLPRRSPQMLAAAVASSLVRSQRAPNRTAEQRDVQSPLDSPTWTRCRSACPAG